MFQAPLPIGYSQLDESETAERIGQARKSLGDDLVILGHHYQRDEIIRWADFRGDSLKLSQIAAQQTRAKWFIFCGVHFMAESADILTTDDQAVILPNLAAGCSMADMANVRQVQNAWRDITAIVDEQSLIPITYVNSTADLKAFVGKHNGACCTSTNALQVLKWAFERGEKLFFFPDQHLGRNTAIRMGINPETEMVVWNPHLPCGGVSPQQLRNAKAILWRGHCSVHGRFTVEQIQKARTQYSEVQVIVHPECTLEVVNASDLNGSTEYIIQQIEGSPDGSVWAVGTEINLVSRLQKQNPGKTISCLDPVICPCSTMYRVHPHYLAWVLDNLVEGRVVNQVTVKPEIKRWAKIALGRMLEVS